MITEIFTYNISQVLYLWGLGCKKFQVLTVTNFAFTETNCNIGFNIQHYCLNALLNHIINFK